MTNDDILDMWRAADLAYAEAADQDRLDTLITKIEAEDIAIARFGLGPHLAAYQARYPDAA